MFAGGLALPEAVRVATPETEVVEGYGRGIAVGEFRKPQVPKRKPRHWRTSRWLGASVIGDRYCQLGLTTFGLVGLELVKLLGVTVNRPYAGK